MCLSRNLFEAASMISSTMLRWGRRWTVHNNEMSPCLNWNTHPDFKGRLKRESQIRDQLCTDFCCSRSFWKDFSIITMINATNKDISYLQNRRCYNKFLQECLRRHSVFDASGQMGQNGLHCVSRLLPCDSQVFLQWSCNPREDRLSGFIRVQRCARRCNLRRGINNEYWTRNSSSSSFNA